MNYDHELFRDFSECPWGKYRAYGPTPTIPKPNGLDHHDTSILLGVLNALDRSGAEFNGTADIPSQDRTIKVRIWHDTEVHRLEVIES